MEALCAQLKVRACVAWRVFSEQLSTVMDTKILALQQAGVSAVENAKKLLPKDVDVQPQALRCEYPLHMGFVLLSMMRLID